MLQLFCRLNRSLSVRPSVNDFAHISTLYVSILTKLSMKVDECSIFHYAKVKFILMIQSGKLCGRLSGQICPYFPNYLHNLYKIFTHNFIYYDRTIYEMIGAIKASCSKIAKIICTMSRPVFLDGH